MIARLRRRPAPPIAQALACDSAARGASRTLPRSALHLLVNRQAKFTCLFCTSCVNTPLAFSRPISSLRVWSSSLPVLGVNLTWVGSVCQPQSSRAGATPGVLGAKRCGRKRSH